MTENPGPGGALSANLPEAGRRRRRRVRLLLALAAVALASLGAFWLRRPQPTEVQLATVVREDLQAKVTANGKVQAQRKVDISATVAGQITQIAVREGDRVRKGQFLLQIDSANPRAAARSSESSDRDFLVSVADTYRRMAGITA